MGNNEILFKPNSLIMATSNSNDITSTEYKVFDTFLQRCQFNKGYGFRKAELSREEIKNIIKHGSNTTIKVILNTLNKFKDITLKFTLDKKFVCSNAIAQYSYDPESDIFTCSMTEEVFTVLMDYKEHGGYSPIDLQLVRKARGYYTQKIYGILRRWSKYKESVICTYTLEEIKSVCDVLEGGSYDQYKEFKRRVLNPAIKEINEKLNMIVSFKEIKFMRKVQKIEFTVIDNEQRKYNFEKEKIVESKIVKTMVKKEQESIDSILYMELIDLKIHSNIHKRFLEDYPNFKDYISIIDIAVKRTFPFTGGEMITTQNYKYFSKTLSNLKSSDINEIYK